MFRTFAVFALGLGTVGLLAVTGCENPLNQGPPQEVAVPPAAVVRQPTPPSPDGEHGHKPGSHGGTIVEIGRDNYHAEAVFEKDGVLRVFLLGKDEAKVEEVEVQALKAFAKLQGGTEATPFSLEPAPQPEDTKGKTSQFVGTLPKELWGRPVEVTVTTIRIGADRFRFGFSSRSAEVHGDPAMPAKVADEEERQLYLTPGGKYTAADIKANGNVTASQKFKGAMSAHDMHPKPGDKICPVTETKANPKFSWIVGGKPYEFCCPPCVDEFLKTAKERPAEVKEPGDYVKK